MTSYHQRIICIFGFFLTCSTPVFAQKNLSNASERVAIKEYFLNEMADFMFEKDFDTKQIFNCETFSSTTNSKGDNRITCSNKKTGNMTIETHGSGSEKSSVRICKQGFSNDRDRLKASSFDQKPAEAMAGQVGTMYQMGRTNGWFQDYENIYMESKLSGNNFSCWSILKR